MRITNQLFDKLMMFHEQTKWLSTRLANEPTSKLTNQPTH